MRVRFGRGEEIKYISHLDIMRLWERALTRAGIDVAYSEGFSPHPKLSMAAPLAVGVTAESELLDVHINGQVTPHWFTDALKSQMPPGITLKGVQQVTTMLPSLQSQVRQADYLVELDSADGPEDITSTIDSLLAEETIPWYHERDTGRREYDLRPLIDSINLLSGDQDRCVLEMRLRCDSGGSGRPEQVARALGFSGFPVSIHRVRLILAV
jgi:radical SAM-linked protein